MPNITAQQESNQMAMALWLAFIGVVDESSKLCSEYLRSSGF